MMNVMLVNFNSKYHVEIARKMASRSNVSIKTIFADYPETSYSDVVFANIKKYDSLHFRVPSRIRGLTPDSGEALSAGEIASYADLKIQFLENTDRFSFIPLSVRERSELFYVLLRFFRSHLQRNEYNCIVFRGVPHMGFDNVLYSVARRHKIPTLMIEQTLIDGRSIIIDDYEEWHRIPKQYLSGKSDPEIAALIDPQLLKAVFDENRSLRAVNREKYYSNEYYGYKKAGRTRAGSPLRHIYGILRKSYLWIQQVLPLDPGKRRRYYSSCILNEITNRSTYFRVVETYRRHLKPVQNFYNDKSTLVDQGADYVFFALHLQPEKNTSPLGGVFDEQTLAIDILAESLPPDWLLYVKEHPVQFNRNRTNNHHYRNIEFYKRILRHPNARLVSMSEDHEQIILHARANATVTGTTAWQSLLNGIPALVFGTKWYTACGSAYLVGSVEECRKALDIIRNEGSEKVRRDLLVFLSYYQKHLIRVAYEERDSDLIGLPMDEQINNYINAIMNYRGLKDSEANDTGPSHSGTPQASGL